MTFPYETWLSFVTSGCIHPGEKCTKLLRETEGVYVRGQQTSSEALVRASLEPKSEPAIMKCFPQGKSHGFPEADWSLWAPKALRPCTVPFVGLFRRARDVEEIVTEGDRVAVRWRVSMTHLGDHFGFPASGKKETLVGSTFVIVEGNQITEGWNYMDIKR